jgi:hypothetical protein
MTGTMTLCSEVCSQPGLPLPLYIRLAGKSRDRTNTVSLHSLGRCKSSMFHGDLYIDVKNEQSQPFARKVSAAIAIASVPVVRVG